MTEAQAAEIIDLLRAIALKLEAIKEPSHVKENKEALRRGFEIAKAEGK